MNYKKLLLISACGLVLLGTIAAVPTISERDWQMIKALARSGGVQSGATFPSNPTVNQVFIITTDATTGDCNGAGGSAVTLCYWTGVAWSPFVPNAVSSWPTDSTIKTLTWANSFLTAIRIVNTDGAGMGWYVDPTSGGKSVCIPPSGVEDDCNHVLRLAAGRKQEVQNTSYLPIYTLTESTGELTNITLNGSSSGNAIILYQRICGGDLAGLDPTAGTAKAFWNKDPLSTAPTLTARAGTNRGISVMTFPDSDGAYGVQTSCEIPATVGAVDVVIWWDTTGSGNARFQVADKFYSSNDADDASFNTASVVTAAAGTSGRPNRAVLSNLTVTGIGANRLGRFRFFRDRTEASDTLNAALNVEKVEIWASVSY